MPVRKLYTRRTIVTIAILIVITTSAYLTTRALASPEAPNPARTPATRAALECSNHSTIQTCRAALRRALEAVEWQKKERQKLAIARRGYGVMHALRIASAMYGISLADFTRVARCESHLNPRAKNRRSTATGLMQWLDGSWRTQGLPGFDRTDPYASALAAGRAVARDDGWSQWVCKP